MCKKTWDVKGNPINLSSDVYCVRPSPSGAHAFSAGSTLDPTIREWDTSTWQQVGDPWRGHTTKEIHALAMNSTLVASASNDN